MARSNTLTPAQRTTRARLAAHAMHAKGGTNLEPAREAFLAQFEDEVDPSRVLSPDERAKRAKHAHKAHMLRLSLMASRARQSKKAEAAR